MRFLLLFLLVFVSAACVIENDESEMTAAELPQQLTEIVNEDVLHIDKDYVLGRFNFKKHKKFIKMKPMYCNKEIYLRKEVATAFEKMYRHAKQDGVNLTIVSGTRNFYVQKWIWERKWKKYNKLSPLNRAKKILNFSSMPATSRHHWGTDIDLNSLENDYFDSGKGKKEYDWLVEHAADYGFYLVYTEKSFGRTGYNLERWHWSYMPLANQFLKYYNENITSADIQGFNGAELAEELNVIQYYVNGVGKQVKQYNQYISNRKSKKENSKYL